MSISASSITAQVSHFSSLISQWKKKQPEPTSFSRPLSDVGPGVDRSGKDVVVAIRTRPPLDIERERFRPQSEDDATTAEVGSNAQASDSDVFCIGVDVRAAEPGKVVAHVPAMKWNGPTLTQKSFEADLAFGPDVVNEEVYKRTVEAHSMIDLVLGGGVACVLAYGQTGSGKTHTMEAIERFVARDLFTTASHTAEQLRDPSASVPSAKPESPYEFRVTFLELLGKSAFDLVHGEKEQPKKVDISENKTGSVRPDLEEVVVKTQEELEALITESLSHRRESPTARNPRSSRSHAILTIWVKNLLMPAADEGQLILVDLAGSERYDDSKDHDKKRMDESRENNVALSNLKDCVRARAKAVADDDAFVHIPYRSNRLTLMLKPIFDLESAQLSKTLIIAHVSPHLQDSAHSVNTLSYAAPFKVAIPPSKRAKKYDESDPRTWNNDQLVTWLGEQFGELAVRDVEKLPNDGTTTTKMTVDPVKMFPPPTTGKQATRLYCTEWVSLCFACTTLSGPLDEDMVKLVQNHALDVYSSFGYLWATARTRTRKEVMKTRKQGEDEEYWGFEPTGWSPRVKEMSIPRYVLHDFDRVHGEGYQVALHKVLMDAKARGEDKDQAHQAFERATLEQYIADLRSGKETISEVGTRVRNIYGEEEVKWTTMPAL